MKVWKDESSSKKLLHTRTKKKENNYNIGTKYDKHGNKVSICENFKEVNKETNTKENIKYITRDHTNSLKSDNVKDIGEINNSLLIE